MLWMKDKKRVNIPARSWILSVLLLVALLFSADYYFLHILFAAKKEAQIESFTKEVDEVLSADCPPTGAVNAAVASGVVDSGICSVPTTTPEPKTEETK